MKDTKVKITLNDSGIKAVLKSQFMMDAVMSEGEKLGDPETSFVGFDRCHVIVKERGNANRADS